MVLSMLEFDREVPGRSATPAIQTLSESEETQSGPCEPGKARPSVLPIQTTGSDVRVSSTALSFRPAQATRARSNRSRFITLLHAATKSFTNFGFESLHA